MSELLQKVLTDKAARDDQAMETLVAQSARQFTPWAG